MYRLKSVGVWAAFKTGCALQMVLGALLLLCGGCAWLAMGGNLIDAAITRQLGVSLAPNFIALLIVGILISSVLGSLAWAILAVLYNLAALLTGGLSLNLTPEDTTPSTPPSGWHTPDHLKRLR